MRHIHFDFTIYLYCSDSHLKEDFEIPDEEYDAIKSLFRKRKRMSVKDIRFKSKELNDRMEEFYSDCYSRCIDELYIDGYENGLLQDGTEESELDDEYIELGKNQGREEYAMRIRQRLCQEYAPDYEGCVECKITL